MRLHACSLAHKASGNLTVGDCPWKSTPQPICTESTCRNARHDDGMSLLAIALEDSMMPSPDNLRL